MKPIEITVRGRKFHCPSITSEHAMFFGTLLMTEEELRVYVNDEQPDLAMSMMRDRLKDSSEAMEKLLSGQDFTSEEIQEQIHDRYIQDVVRRLIVRINQDQMPADLVRGIRYKVASRIREIFPEFPLEWVSKTTLNLEPDELVTAIAIPLFASLINQSEKEEDKENSKKKSKGFLSEVQQTEETKLRRKQRLEEELAALDDE
jgi:hypothetical protein